MTLPSEAANQKRGLEYVYLIGTVSISILLSYLDNLGYPLINIFVQIFTLRVPSAVFPFTVCLAFLTFAFSLFSSRNLIYSLTLPFAFLGIFELAWHAIPQSSPIDPMGIAVVLSWASVGFMSMRKWKITNLTIILVAAEILTFIIWYFTGFNQTSLDSTLLNIITKMILGVLFIQVFHAGFNRGKTRRFPERWATPIQSEVSTRA